MEKVSYLCALVRLYAERISRRVDCISMLKRVDVVDVGELTGDNAKHLSIFYTGLYRALTFPRRMGTSACMWDYWGAVTVLTCLCVSLMALAEEVHHTTGELVHYSPYDQQGKVYPGILVTDNGFWDTFRSVYPLLGLAYRKELGG